MLKPVLCARTRCQCATAYNLKEISGPEFSMNGSDLIKSEPGLVDVIPNACPKLFRSLLQRFESGIFSYPSCAEIAKIFFMKEISGPEFSMNGSDFIKSEPCLVDVIPNGCPVQIVASAILGSRIWHLVLDSIAAFDRFSGIRSLWMLHFRFKRVPSHPGHALYQRR